MLKKPSREEALRFLDHDAIKCRGPFPWAPWKVQGNLCHVASEACWGKALLWANMARACGRHVFALVLPSIDGSFRGNVLRNGHLLWWRIESPWDCKPLSGNWGRMFTKAERPDIRLDKCCWPVTMDELLIRLRHYMGYGDGAVTFATHGQSTPIIEGPDWSRMEDWQRNPKGAW